MLKRIQWCRFSSTNQGQCKKSPSALFSRQENWRRLLLFNCRLPRYFSDFSLFPENESDRRIEIYSRFSGRNNGGSPNRDTACIWHNGRWIPREGETYIFPLFLLVIVMISSACWISRFVGFCPFIPYSFGTLQIEFLFFCKKSTCKVLMPHQAWALERVPH